MHIASPLPAARQIVFGFALLAAAPLLAPDAPPPPVVAAPVVAEPVVAEPVVAEPAPLPEEQPAPPPAENRRNVGSYASIVNPF